MNNQPDPTSTDLVSETLRFMRGTKTSEYMSDSLRSALYYSRRLASGEALEALLADVLAHDRSVLVAGSAGGGKTMLLNSVLKHLSRMKVPSIELGEDPPDGGAVVVIPDLTAVAGDRSALLAEARQIGPLFIAANEGVLRTTDMPAELAGVAQSLRDLQSGNDSVCDSEAAVVVDLAGLDPVAGALPFLLRHNLLHDAVRSIDDGCDADNCPRLQALEQLLAPNAAETVAELVHAAVGPGELLFRDVWDFLSDVLLGGNCTGDVPTSPWFWRCFYGESFIAAEISDALRPEYLSLPRVAPFLYRGDWSKVDDLLGTEPAFVVPGREPFRIDDPTTRTELTHWLRIQAALLMRRSGGPRSAGFVGELASSLEQRVTKKNEVFPLVQGLNAYFHRKKAADAVGTVLDLWVEMSVERATARAAALVSLGQVSSTRLEILRSSVIANVEGVKDQGSRLFLAGSNYTGERPLLVLDVKLFKALSRGRPVATSDRSGDDADFAIRRFMVQVASSMELEDSSRIALMSWDEVSTAKQSAWRVDSDTNLIKGAS